MEVMARLLRHPWENMTVPPGGGMQVRAGRASRFATLMMLATLPGCSSGDLLASRDLLLVEAGFQTDKHSYPQTGPAGAVATIRVTLDNRFGSELLPVPCTGEAPEWTLERQVGEGWEAVATAACLLVSWVQASVPVGTMYRGTVRLATTVPAGTYRLVFGMLEVSGTGSVPVVDGRARSNLFGLTN